MKIFENPDHWKAYRTELSSHGCKLGFVPTMGALHEGHISLVKKSLKENDSTVVSIFVNPTQFNNADDLNKYPRTLENDLAKLKLTGLQSVLLPNAEHLYADHYRFKVTESEESKILCGAHRPGHFDGVLTVMTKLLGLTTPHFCYMGEKDYQQFRLVSDLVKYLFLNTTLVGCPTVREESGLAMSSRNQRLTDAGRTLAANIYREISRSDTLSNIRNSLESKGIAVEYLEEHWGRRFVAAHVEQVRLIDNVKV